MSSHEKAYRERIAEVSDAMRPGETETEALKREVAELRLVVEELLRRLYGRKSEKIGRDEVGEAQAPDAAETAPASAPVTKKVPAAGHGREPFVATLPRQTTIGELPEEKRTCTICKKALVAIGKDVSERGHLSPVRIIVLRHEAMKYACPDGHEVKTGPGAPEGLVPRAKWSTQSYAFIAVSKYGDHLPLDRIEGMLKRQGVHLPKSTMGEMVDVVAERVTLILEQMKREILSEKYLHADETPIKVLRENERSTNDGWLWVFAAGPKIVFEFDFSRGQSVPERFLAGWSSNLHVDGYAGYDAVVRKNGIRRIGCHVHVRRKWKNASDLGDARAKPMLDAIKELYLVEREARERIEAERLEEEAAFLVIAEARNSKSRAISARMRTILDELIARPDITPKSPLGKALTYTVNQWPTMLHFLDDPRIELDNNLAERAIRPIAIGRKNWLFAGSSKGAANAAKLYSIINTCKAIGIDPIAYLTDVLESVSPKADLAALTPWAWALANPPPTSG